MVQQYQSPTSNSEDRFEIRTSADKPVTVQQTAKGYEIPVPSKDQIFEDFTKIATAKPDDEGEK